MVAVKKVEPNFDFFLNIEIVIKKACKMFIFANITILKSSYFEDWHFGVLTAGNASEL